MSNISKNVSILGCLAFIVNILLSIFFYLERCVMPDMAFMIFHITNKPKLFIQHYRFISTFTLSFVDIASSLQLSLKSICIAYSVSFPVLFLIGFLIIVYYFKNFKIGLIYLIYHHLIITHSFFWPLHELLQAISLLLVYLGYLESVSLSSSGKITFWIGSTFTFFILVFAHPLVIIPIIFVFLWRYRYGTFPNFMDIKLLGIIFCIMILKYILVKNPYEQGAMENLNNFIHFFPKYHHFISFKLFFEYLILDYYWLFPLFIIIQIYYSKYGNYWKLFVFNSFFIGMILLVNVCYKDGARQFYLESQFSILGLLVAFPVCEDLVPKLNPKILVFFLLLMLSSFYVRIIQTSTTYQSRLDIYREQIKKNQKMIFSSSSSPLEKLQMTWCSSFEIWLLSTLERGKSSSIIIHDNPDQFDWTLNRNDIFLTNWEVIEYRDLNPKYFIFKDSLLYKKYQFVNPN